MKVITGRVMVAVLVAVIVRLVYQIGFAMIAKLDFVPHLGQIFLQGMVASIGAAVMAIPGFSSRTRITAIACGYAVVGVIYTAISSLGLREQISPQFYSGVVWKASLHWLLSGLLVLGVLAFLAARRRENRK